MKKYMFIGAVLVLLILSFGTKPSPAVQLQQSLTKYKDTGVSYQTLERLSPYNKLIDYYSQFTFFKKKHKVNPDFIRALIIAESNIDPRAVSSKGAMGLGQIIYTTGKQAAKELSKYNYRFDYIDPQKLLNFKKEDLFDPATNILLTCYLISKYNYKFNGRLELVLSAWNAGEYHKSLKKGRPAPYAETYNLIGKTNAYFIDILKKRKRYSIHSRQ